MFQQPLLPSLERLSARCRCGGHIYDYLLSATAAPGRQSFQWRQQWLPERQQVSN